MVIAIMAETLSSTFTTAAACLKFLLFRFSVKYDIKMQITAFFAMPWLKTKPETHHQQWETNNLSPFEFIYSNFKVER